MKRAILLLILLYSFIKVFSQDATAIYKNTVNSTVTIETEDGLGSGFFVGENIIATNYHVIKGDTEAYCYTNNSDTKYKIEGYVAIDTSVDLILLKVSGLKRTPIRIAATPTEIGQKVYAIGSPKGLPATISDGIVSALRDFNGYKLIQITAPISHGSSGGPILNSSGELIGVSVASLKEGQNLNFAIPKANLKVLLSNKRNTPLLLSTLIDNTISPKEISIAINNNPSLNYTIQDYDKAIEINPNDANAYYYRAKAKYYSSDYEGAIQDYTKVIELNPKDVNAYYYRGYTKYFSGDYNGAIQDYTEVIELAPNDSFFNDAYQYRAEAEKKLGDNEGFRKDSSKVNNLEDPPYVVYFKRGAAKYFSGDYEGAIQEYTTAIELNPTNAYAYYNRSLAKVKIGDHNGAKQDLSKAQDLGYTK